jgi:UDP:flavonoid glycosyltransferase YjiC (YdhE family)
LPKSPQIEILKRASLFLTHNGMNSTSESIHYGVPMICLPQGKMSDQPLVAERIADELGCGIRLDSENLKPNELVSAIRKVLDDKSYLERTLRLAHISQKTNGALNGANYIIELIDKHNKKNF